MRPRVIDSLVGIATTSAFPVGIYWVSLPVPKIKQVQLPTYADDVAQSAFARRAAVRRAAVARYLLPAGPCTAADTDRGKL